MKDDTFPNSSVLQFSRDPSVEANWFKSYEVSTYGGENSLDLMKIDKRSNTFDIVICNHVLEHVQYDNAAMSELGRILKPDGFVFLSFPDPIEGPRTVEWEKPREDQHYHWRVYGRDVEDRFRKFIPQYWVAGFEAKDSSTGAPDLIYFIAKSTERIDWLKKKLPGLYIVNTPQHAPVASTTQPLAPVIQPSNLVGSSVPSGEYGWAPSIFEKMKVSDTVNGSPIHPNDNMRSAGRDWHYYSVGKDALWNICQAMVNAGLKDARRILDFPSGFGRVTRYMRAAFPNAEIDIGDIWKEAVEHCATTYNANIVEVNDDLRQIVCDPYDLIFCGSLLTHFNPEKSAELLDFFCDKLNVGGVMVVTFCGRKNLDREKTHFNASVFGTPETVQRLTDEYVAGKFAFVEYPNQKNYGRSFTPISWFHEYFMKRNTHIIIGYKERGWDDNQDVLIAKRIG